jgi:putative drug exporter of the RND superfamily
MKLTFGTGRLADFSARRPWWVIGLWVVLLAAAIAGFPGLSHALTASEMQFLNSPESAKGQKLIEQKVSGNSGDVETLLIHSDKYTVDDSAFRQVVQQSSAAVASKTEAVQSAFDFYQVSAVDPSSAKAMVSADRHSTFIYVTLAPGDKDLGTYLSAVEGLGRDGFTVTTVGQASIGDELSSAATSDLRSAETVGLPITLVVLVLVFGAFVAAGVSLILALTTIGVTVGAVIGIGSIVPQSFFIVNIVMMIGLAVGIDYALLIIQRYREERRQGLGKHDAIVMTGRTASRAVLFSGGTVMLALLGLFIVPITTFRSLGLGAVLVVGIAVLAMLTLVPALISLLGDRLDWPVLRRPSKMKAGERVHSGVTMYRGFWGRLTQQVMKRPLVAVIVTVIILLAATVPAFSLKTGAAGGADSLPDGPRRAAYELLVNNFPAGMLAPVQIVVDGKETAALDADIATLTAKMDTSGDFASAATVSWNQTKDVAVVTAPLAVDPNSQEAYGVITTLRASTVRDSFAGSNTPVYVTGQTASSADSTHLVSRLTPLVLAFVLGLTFILLMVVFRSLIVPLKAIIMNLLSVGAAYGLLVIVFQKGVGHELFGFQQTTTVQSWVPIFLFCILFGLSMDYHVFLLSRIREHYEETGKNKEAVAVGLRATSRIITGAAAIMVVVFATFAAGHLVMLQQLGFGLAVAVLLDATLIRSILVPASMALLGRVNWYLPVVLHRILPRIHVEGPRTKPAIPPA